MKSDSLKLFSERKQTVFIVWNWCFALLFLCCSAPVFSQTFELNHGDTINKTDAGGLRQGKWIITNASKKLPDYGPDQVIEESMYVDGKREGLRKQYYPNGQIKSEVTYHGNIPKGYSKMYFPNGNVSEEGTWKNGGWEGAYKYYYEDGKTCYVWNFKDGKREGEQKYFYPNGELNYTGIWKDGNEAGILKQYNETGQLVAEKNYSDGKLDEANSKYYKVPVSVPVSNPVVTGGSPANNSAASDDKKDDIGYFTGTGYYQLKNKNGQITKDGTFQNGNLTEGKMFQYGSGGKLIRTIIYKDNKIIQTLEEK